MFAVSSVVSFILLLIGVPIFLCFGVFGVWVCIYVLEIPWATVGITMFNSITKYVLVALPLFIMAAYIMLESGLSRRLIDFFNSWVGHFKGGLAIVMVLSMGFFGAINGSILAAIIAIGAVMLPMMEEQGYSRPLIAALAASSAGLDTLIPPSNGAIIFASITETPVSQIFASTIVPGIIQMLLLVAVCVWFCRDLPRSPRATWKERWQATYRAITALFLPVIILGGIFGGIFTAVEAAAIACAYALFVGTFIHRSMTWAKVWNALGQTASITCVVFIIIATASTFSIVLVYTQFPQSIQNLAVEYGLTELSLLAAGGAGALFLGTFLEAVPNLLVTTSILAPAATDMGLSLLRLYGVIVISVAIGLLTPPVCIGVYTAAGMAEVNVRPVFRYVYPWLFGTLIVSLILVMVFPPLTTWLPSLIAH